MKWFERSKEYLTDQRFMQEVLTISKIALAFIIFVVAFGVIDDFNPDTVWQYKSGVRLIGFFLSLDIITNALSERAEFDARYEEQEIKEAESEGREETRKIDEEKAIIWVSKTNEQDRKNAVEKKRQKVKNEYTEEISKYQSRYDRVKDRKYNFWQLWKKHKRKSYKKKAQKAKWERSNADHIDFDVSVQGIDVDDLKFKGMQERGHESTTKKKRYNQTAGKPVRKKLRYKNIIQSVLFFGLQGAILFSATTASEAVLYAFIMIPTFISGGFAAYFYTYRRSVGIWLSDQRDKLKDLKNMNKDIANNPDKYTPDFEAEVEEKPEEELTVAHNVFDNVYD